MASNASSEQGRDLGGEARVRAPCRSIDPAPTGRDLTDRTRAHQDEQGCNGSSSENHHRLLEYMQESTHPGAKALPRNFADLRDPVGEPTPRGEVARPSCSVVPLTPRGYQTAPAASLALFASRVQIAASPTLYATCTTSD